MASPAAGDLHEIPRIERDQRERHDFERGERGGHRHVEFGLPGPVPVMARADQPAAEIEDGVEIDRAQRRDPLDQAHLVEDDGDDHGDEEFEEAFDPQMDDPEPPRIDDRVVGLRTEEERRQIEQRNGERRDQEEVGEAAPFADRGARAPPRARPGRTRTTARSRAGPARSGRSPDIPSPDCRTRTSCSAAIAAGRPIRRACCRRSRPRPRRRADGCRAAGRAGSCDPEARPRTGHRRHRRSRSRRSPTANATCAADCSGRYVDRSMP